MRLRCVNKGVAAFLVSCFNTLELVMPHHHTSTVDNVLGVVSNVANVGSEIVGGAVGQGLSTGECS